MANTLVGRKRIRKFFGKIREVAEMPNLIEVQKASYDQFLMVDEPEGGRADEGLQSVFKSVFPISDFASTALLEFVRYTFEQPKYDVDECRQRGITFAAPLKVTLRLIVFDVDPDTGAKSVKDIKEQDVYMGDMPLMTDNGTFIVNGTERVIVSQMHRSPGVFFDHDKGKTHSSGKLLFAARIIPYRGSWLDVEFDAKDIVHVRIDRKRKLPVTSLLFALGLDGEEILSTFYNRVAYERDGADWRVPFDAERLKGFKASVDLIDADSGEVVLEAGKKLNARNARLIGEKGTKFLKATDEDLVGQYIAEDLVNGKTGEIWAEAGDEISEKLLKALDDVGVTEIPVLDIDHVNVGPYIRNTLAVDKNSGREGALFDIYRVMRPGEPPTLDTAEAMFHSLFFDAERYDLSAVGRVKMNMRLDLDAADTVRTLRREDMLAVVKALVDLRDGKGEIDDIDHLGNRRVRSVGELMENQYRLGLLRMERAIKERMSSVDIDTVMPQDLINAKPAAAAVREFFGSSQLSQFMDQTNPLSEVTHKRRLSALGPGGLTRERAGVEVRDVHPSHYGRMCPIETPEGPNIGLIGSLASFARINSFGFIETPYRKVVGGRVTDEIEYLTASQEDDFIVAQANAPLKADGHFAEDRVLARSKGGEVDLIPAEEIGYMDVSPRQMVSVATSLIPFLEHDDANRALMGANMQRQAVPLLRSESPVVGTGMEGYAAIDAGDVLTADKAGVVLEVSADVVTVQLDEGGTQDYFLRKFDRSNQGTSYNQRVIVSAGDRIEAGEVIADGPATENGELALGKNLLVAFMTWEGHNFEDAIILSQDLVKDDTLSSIHIEEYEVDARDTKLGKEEITRDLPNVSPDLLKDLDERGIIRIGAEVRPGDILVGKVTPKGETELSAEERLLRAIFNEKSREVRDTSLKVPHGEQGTIIAVKEFNAEDGDDELGSGVNRRVVVYIAQKRKITEGDKLAGRHGNKGVIAKILPVEDMPFLADGTPVDVILNPLGIPGRMNFGQVLETHLGWIAKQGWKVEGTPEWAVRLPEEAREAAPGTKVATPVFDGAFEEEIAGLLDSTLPTRDGDRLIDSTGKTRLFDGRSGEPFPAPISVGYMYILKLHHLVDDKIHARSTGPYSMITQQPLGGKAQFGGQRFGEMEVWALEAYGAAYALQELLTIKSDDILGRVKVYEAIVKGENIQEPGIPESFKVLMKEMQSLCLNVEVLSADGTAVNLRDTDDDAFRAAEELGINLSSRFESSSIDEI
ncbi:DNA-directed RNA polymerase subunit beta [Microbacterium sp. ARD31]|uniref:DNA-directed RNA polymerase subunit beta n=1 Tax=Microbacterium sp. ARD31 TaxID=2962576 RepID=UPI0028823447|nr:DNA-directed RNA polymerase subunit beta [Microbacterium sp. ARD31]MDT0185063.1 DNA-directed RNA polymerase subunit beta [Microbacterium sp. ARD31]